MRNRDDELREILEGEWMDPEGPENAEIQGVRADVEAVIKTAFGHSLSFRYGGSKAKGTMLLSSYDLDLLCYFHRDNIRAGNSLTEIYSNVLRELRQHYRADPGTTAIRLHAVDDRSHGPGLRVDVVPGRFVDDTAKADVHLHQADGAKTHLKTNPDVHIDYVKGFQALEEVRALKLWRVKSSVHVRQFPFEILCIESLKRHLRLGHSARVEAVLSEIAATATPPRIIDPANSGNDLSPMLANGVWNDLRIAATRTIADLPIVGWSGVLMTTPIASGSAPLAAAIRSSSSGSKPWSA